MTCETYPAVGIDLATTYSAIAYLDGTRRPVTVVNAEGNLTTPSVVLFEDAEIIVGEEALRALGTEAERIAAGAKRDIGQPFYHREINGRRYPPEVIQACIVKKLADDARSHVGEVRGVVITVPAYFDETKRKATQDVGRIAGLEVLDTINEPTAAALAFGLRPRLPNASGPDPGRERYLVYDLGGGTFDVTVMEIDGRRFTTIATDGDFRLGGQDWDYRMVDYVAEQFAAQYGGDPRDDLLTLSQLWRNCESAKRTLSVRKEASVSCEFAGHAMRVKLPRELFEQLTADLLERTLFTTRQVLHDAGLSWDGIDRVLLTGGSTRMPAVRAALRQLSGKEPDCSVSPEEAVAHGAALHAGLVLDRLRGEPPTFEITNVNSHSLAIVGNDPQTNLRRTCIMIPRNSALPMTHRCLFYLARTDQRSVVVDIVEGEAASPEGCIPIGRCVIRGLPPGLAKGTPVEVLLAYESNGRLRVSVQVPNLNWPLEHEMIRQHGLSEPELQNWRQFLAARM